MLRVSLLSNATPRACSRLCGAMLVLMLLGVVSYAQSSDAFKPDQGNGGRNAIQGDIYGPTGRRLDRQVLVKITSMRGEYTTLSGSNGSFAFRQLVGGRYQISVAGDREYESASETVEITEPNLSGSGRPGQIYNVQLYLRPKRGGDPAKAAVLNAAFANVPKPALDLYEKAVKSAEEGDRKKSIEQLKAALVIYPEFVLAHNGLGVLYMKLGELDKAAEAFRSGLKISPDVFILHLNHGVVLLYQKHYAEAEAELRRALEKDESSTTAHFYRGRALIGLRRYDEAEADLQRSVKLGGDEASLAHRYLAGIYVERGENTRAVSELEKYLNLVPKANDAAQIRELIKQLRATAKARN